MLSPDDLTKLLRDHSQRHGIRDGRIHCRCGWKAERGEGAFLSHQAQEIHLAVERETHLLKRAIRTLLPGLRNANYIERWSPASPAVQALNILSEFAHEPVQIAGDLQDPDVPTVHPRRPEGEPRE